MKVLGHNILLQKLMARAAARNLVIIYDLLVKAEPDINSHSIIVLQLISQYIRIKGHKLKLLKCPESRYRTR